MMNKTEFRENTFKDHRGYLIWKESKKPVHRTIAYKGIYLKNKDKYPLPFSSYQVHHKDNQKENNRPENLELIPIREHELKHNILRHEYSLVNTYMIFAFIAIIWFAYLGAVTNYKYDLKGVLFMLFTTILGAILIYFVNRKKKGIRYV